MTVFTGRTIPTTTLTNNRIGWDYLLDWQGNIILDWNSEPIITIIPGGQLGLTQLTARPAYSSLTWEDVYNDTWDTMSSRTWDSLYSGPLPTILIGRIIP